MESRALQNYYIPNTILLNFITSFIIMNLMIPITINETMGVIRALHFIS